MPLAAQFAEPVSTKLEVVTEPFKHPVLTGVLLGRDRAGDVVGPLALFAVVDEIVEPRLFLQPPQGFRIKAGPKQREVADVAVDLSPGIAHAGLGLDEHFANLLQGPARRIPDLIDRVAMNESRQQGGDVVHKRRVGDPQPSLERELGQARKKAIKRYLGMLSIHISWPPGP